ncbi:acetaldehyde dehydrogenase [Paenibacillus mucilaginosus]|uniref:acetaldehyde dehydrogenase (acetylating) n=1 Tax=Paenibacillus mucilaginosus TaxID=61624 RepID=UPI003D1B8C9F
MRRNSDRLKAAILGTGNIGTDLLVKILQSKYLECTYFIGRNRDSHGLSLAGSWGVRTSHQSIRAIQEDPDCCDLVFDATSARDHLLHAPILKKLGKTVIDLTPARIGTMCIPAINLEACVGKSNINMVTCGGQSSVPLAHAIGQTHSEVEYIEVVSTVASKGAGPATRINLDEYIETTESCIRQFSGSRQSKTILNLNPAEPCIDMQSTLLAKVKNPSMEQLTKLVNETAANIRQYVPGYQLIMPPTFKEGHIQMMIRVQGRGDYLPPYAGNLDIINCAAIATAERLAKARLTEGVVH